MAKSSATSNADDLIGRFLALWQEHLTALTEEAAGETARLLAAIWSSGLPPPRPADNAAAEPQPGPTPGAAPATAASGERDDLVADLSRRVAELEQRLAAIEDRGRAAPARGRNRGLRG